MNKPRIRETQYVGRFFHNKNDCAFGEHFVVFDTMEELRAWEEKHAIKLYYIREQVKRGSRWYGK